MNKKMILVLVVIALSLCGCEAQRIEAETALTEAQAELTEEEAALMDAQAELEEAETDRATLEAFAAIVQELLSELGTERQFQHESLQEMLDIIAQFGTQLEQLSSLMMLAIIGNLALTAVLMFGVIAGGIVVTVALLRRKRQPVVMLPRNQAPGWLPVSDTTIIQYQTQDMIQIADLQEIVIE